MPLLGRRRPLLRAAMVGGASYLAGKHVADRQQHEAEQDAAIGQMEQYQPPQYQAPPEPAPAPIPAPAAAPAAQSPAMDRKYEDVWYVADAVPPGSSAAVALIEHRWAIPLREAIERAGGVALADSWVHPADLTAAGAAVHADIARD